MRLEDSPDNFTPNVTENLPIHLRREEIIEAIRAHPVVVIAGETGSGKTTQIPKFLLDCGLGRKGLIGCTQPRRVAALSVAQRIAHELGVTYGEAVGAKIRFTDQTRKDTRIKLMTDGILLNELQEDPFLRSYEAIVIDEAHERSLNIDFIIGCLRQLLKRRSDLKIIITSATIDTGSFAQAFQGAPVIEVSGRMFPVETHYRPPEESETESDYVQQSADVIHEIIQNNRAGDILAFLPSERDIHELNRLLEAGPARQCDRLPLFGRLANTDQQRIFQPGGRRRIILSTNIAETSLTVPGIRYVVDTGLARMSRYSPHSRTQRLPIERIAQSSAEQRKGRCGRVSDGVCYRLYSEQDFLSRPRFTTPEILRSNLASVILRMMAFNLGDIRSFPFIDPPADNAITSGYRLLAELGAVRLRPKKVDDTYELTSLGRRLARIPVDPTVGRMLLEAQREGVLTEMLVIASGLSIQDPRERPAEAAKEADEIHKQFTHPESDFLTLFNIWSAYHEQLENLSQSQLRKFCKAHYLAFQRMREWRDIHDQLARILKTAPLRHQETGERAENPSKKRSDAPVVLSTHYSQADYAAIHRSILSGLLSNIAQKVEGHTYRGGRNRKALLFPGSVLFDQEASKKMRKAAYSPKSKPKPLQTKSPDWVICGEWMETSRLFLRTAARIEVPWVEQVASNLIQVRHSEPFWSTKAAAALCQERHLLFGLELRRAQVSCSPIDPAQATEIFIRNGLIEQAIRERPTFLQHNADCLRQAESELARRRLGSVYLLEDNLYHFYRARLEAVGSYAELRRFAKVQHGGSFDFLFAREQDLLPCDTDDVPVEGFPKTLQLGGLELPLHYRNQRGSDDDGVTLNISPEQVEALQQGILDWAVPGYLEEKIEYLLRSLPKSIRVQLHPLKERARELRWALKPSARPLPAALATYLRDQYQIDTYPDQWNSALLPDHLKPRIEVRNTRSELLAASRDIGTIHKQLGQKKKQIVEGCGLQSIPAWKAAVQSYERRNVLSWSFGNLPESIDLSGASDLPLKAFPALVADGNEIRLSLLPERELALEATSRAWPLLAEHVLGKEIAWIQRDLRELKRLGTLLLPLGGYDAARISAWRLLRRYLFACETPLPLSEIRFKASLTQAKERSAGVVFQLVERLQELLDAREAVTLLLEQKRTKQAIIYPGMRSHLEQVAPATLLEDFDYADLENMTRYLRAMQLRARRARESIQRDIEKSQRIAPFEAKLSELETIVQDHAPKLARRLVKPYRTLLEEFKVSIFAQELGTAQKVSEKRLERLAASIQNHALHGRADVSPGNGELSDY